MTRLEHWTRQLTENLRRSRLGLPELGISEVRARGTLVEVHDEIVTVHLYVSDVPIVAVQDDNEGEESENLLYFSKGGME